MKNLVINVEVSCQKKIVVTFFKKLYILLNSTAQHTLKMTSCFVIANINLLCVCIVQFFHVWVDWSLVNKKKHWFYRNYIISIHINDWWYQIRNIFYYNTCMEEKIYKWVCRNSSFITNVYFIAQHYAFFIL